MQFIYKMEHKTLNFGIYSQGARDKQKGIFLESEGFDISSIKESQEFIEAKPGKTWAGLLKVSSR